MTFLPLNLGVRRASDAEKGSSGDGSQLKTQTEKTLQRDQHTCRFCGFHSDKFQRVLAYDGGDKALPFVTACIFCEQCLFLERAGMMGSGALIWLPEIGQAELHHIARAIYMARSVKGNMADSADRAFEALTARRTDAKKRLGSDDPLMLATIMHENLSDADYKASAAKLSGIRLLPFDKYRVRTKNGETNQFPHMVNYWLSSEGPYAAKPVEKWSELFQSTLAAVGNA